MLLVLAQDDGRLSNHPETGPRFRLVDDLPHRDMTRFLSVANAMTAPFVLFWHVSAAPALAMLGSLQRTGGWPALLKGVVLYRAAHFAGLGTSIAAQAALREHGLEASPVHIFKPVLSDPPNQSAIDLVVSFANAADRWVAGDVPFWRLDPDGPRYVRIAALLLGSLAAGTPYLEAKLLKQLRWSTLHAELEKDGVDCPLEPSPGSIHNVVTDIRRSHPVTTLPCPACGPLYAMRHGQLDQQLEGQDQTTSTALLASIAERTRRLVENQCAISRSGTTELEESLSSLGVGDLHEPIMGLVTELFSAQCGMVARAGLAERSLDQIESALKGHGADLGDVTKALNSLLQCGAQEGIKV